jgi:hypothetical protein
MAKVQGFLFKCLVGPIRRPWPLSSQVARGNPGCSCPPKRQDAVLSGHAHEPGRFQFSPMQAIPYSPWSRGCKAGNGVTNRPRRRRHGEPVGATEKRGDPKAAVLRGICSVVQGATSRIVGRLCYKCVTSLLRLVATRSRSDGRTGSDVSDV